MQRCIILSVLAAFVAAASAFAPTGLPALRSPTARGTSFRSMFLCSHCRVAALGAKRGLSGRICTCRV